MFKGKIKILFDLLMKIVDRLRKFRKTEKSFEMFQEKFFRRNPKRILEKSKSYTVHKQK